MVQITELYPQIYVLNGALHLRFLFFSESYSINHSQFGLGRGGRSHSVQAFLPPSDFARLSAFLQFDVSFQLPISPSSRMSYSNFHLLNVGI